MLVGERFDSLPLWSRPRHFGEVVAALIIAIGLVPFASAGLWMAP
jgi:hypothetical protein